MRIVSDLQMQVGGAALHGDPQQVVNIHAGMTPSNPSMMARREGG